MQSKHQCVTAPILHILYNTKKSQKCILTRKKTLDEGASVFGKTMKRTKHSAGSLMTVVALVKRNYVKICQRKLLTQSNPIQSNPIHG